MAQISQTTIDTLVAHALATYEFSTDVMTDEEAADAISDCVLGLITETPVEILYDSKSSPALDGLEIRIEHFHDDERVSCYTTTLLRKETILIQIAFGSIEQADAFASEIIRALEAEAAGV